MAIRFVASGGSNTAPYDTWAKAATSLATALAASTSSGDVIVIQYDAVPATDAELAADTIYTLAADISLVAASNDGGSAYTLTEMGTGAWIGNSTTNRYLRFGGSDRRCRFWGLTLRTAGSTADAIQLGNSSAGLSITAKKCYLWAGNTAGGFGAVEIGVGGYGYFELEECTFRFGSTSQYIQYSAHTVLKNCIFAPVGSVPSTLFGGTSTSSNTLEMIGCDASAITGTLLGNMQTTFVVVADRCTFGAGMTVLAAQTSNPNKDSGSVRLSDSLIGSTRVSGFYDALGSCVRETGIYYTGGAAGSESWKIVTSANCSFRVPFEAPWVDWYNTGTSAITPRFEILRDGSATPYTDAQVWGEFSWKNTASSPLGNGLKNDWQQTAGAIAGTAGTDQAAGAGLGAWTGESGTAWSGKVDSDSAITPTEAGALRGRIVVAAPSITLYVDPVIRT